MRWTHDVTVRRQVRTPNGFGGWSVTWRDVGHSVARVNPVSAKDRIEYAQAQYPVTHKVYLPAGTDVRPEDRIACGERSLAVKGVYDPAGMGHHLVALCEELTSPAS